MPLTPIPNMESTILYIITALLALCMYYYLLVKEENLKRSLSLCFLRVTMPKKNSDLDEKQETTRDFKETIAIMEQLLASLNSIWSNKMKKKIF